MQHRTTGPPFDEFRTGGGRHSQALPQRAAKKNLEILIFKFTLW